MSSNAKVALVTGSSRGIGRAIAERLAAAGASVVVNYSQRSKAAEEVVRAIVAQGGKAVSVQGDISKAADVRRLFDEAERAFGTLDIVVANAAVFFPKALAESTEEDFDRMFEVNAKGVFLTLQQAANRIDEGGSIVVVSTGPTKMNMAGSSIYAASKGAAEQFVPTLARELGPRNVNVNTVSPGFTETDMMLNEMRAYGASLSPFGRVGSADEVAAVVAFLTSPDGHWVTAQNVQAGGGVAF
ncbi:MAG: SDR family oxidoreductase [Vicinamibacteraceae bacterium]